MWADLLTQTRYRRVIIAHFLDLLTKLSFKQWIFTRKKMVFVANRVVHPANPKIMLRLDHLVNLSIWIGMSVFIPSAGKSTNSARIKLSIATSELRNMAEILLDTCWKPCIMSHKSKILTPWSRTMTCLVAWTLSFLNWLMEVTIVATQVVACTLYIILHQSAIKIWTLAILTSVTDQNQARIILNPAN